MFTPFTTYLVYFELPDGMHLATHRTVIRPREGKTQEADVKQLREQITLHIMQNPDAKIHWDKLKAIKHESELYEAVEELRAQDPERPLAHDLGLDATNRLLTNPEVARTLAAARGVEQGVGV